MAKGRAVAIVLDEAEKRELTALTRKHGAPQSLAEREPLLPMRPGQAERRTHEEIVIGALLNERLQAHSVDRHAF